MCVGPNEMDLFCFPNDAAIDETIGESRDYHILLLYQRGRCLQRSAL